MLRCISQASCLPWGNAGVGEGGGRGTGWIEKNEGAVWGEVRNKIAYVSGGTIRERGGGGGGRWKNN